MSKKVNSSNSLLSLYPEIAKQWHPIKNGTIIPSGIIAGTNKKYWWVCDKGHEWMVGCSIRIRKISNCPYCSNRKVCKDNCLATLYPELAKEWNCIKNKEFTPYNVLAGTHVKYWWICDKGHEWISGCSDRIYKNNNCPYCSNRKVCKDNCLTTLYPDVAKQWHPTKNGNITSNDVVAGTHKKYWWICDKGHEWQTTCKSRTELKTNCPYCANYKVCEDNNLVFVHPNVAKEWNYIKNNISPEQVIAGSGKKYWWICDKGHEWQATCDKRILLKTGCPYCSNKKVCKDNCLTTLYPDIAKQWHLIKNNNITPNDIVAGTTRKYWWICDKGHEWKASCGKRTGTAKRGCPICCESKGEKRITEYLKLNKKIYKSQFLVKNIGKFDFGIKTTEKCFFIEYHGQQHYHPSDFGSKEKDAKEKMFIKGLKRDIKKENFCKKHNIDLVVIPYWDFNRIEEILDDVFIGKKPVFSEPPEIVLKYKNVVEKHMLNKLTKIGF